MNERNLQRDLRKRSQQLRSDLQQIDPAEPTAGTAIAQLLDNLLTELNRLELPGETEEATPPGSNPVKPPPTVTSRDRCAIIPAASPPPAVKLPPPPPKKESAVASAPQAFQHRAWFTAVPSWLVSMAVHMVVLLALAMLWLPEIIDAQAVMVVAAVSTPQEELLQTQEISMPLESLSAEAPSLANVTADLGSADLGTTLAEANVVTAYTAAELETGELAEVGALFGATGKAMARVGNGSGGAEFFGVKAAGNRFVFIVDSSNSMRGDKFRDACEELMYAIRRLSAQQSFYVIFFDQDAERMTFAPNKTPEASFASATTSNIQKTEAWVKSVQNELKTDPYEAVVFACSIAPDAIYLLTDGRFTDKGMTERFLRKENLYIEPGVGKLPKVVVHTVGFYDPAGEETLKRIAAEHQGTYRFVPRPKK